jgi:multidrug efflux pump subunit AcrA (membrane-fusion protein)
LGRLLGWLVIVALLALGGLAVWQRFGRPVEVGVASVARGPVIATVFATGWIEPQERRFLRPTRAGVVERIFAKEGAEVRAGEPLATLRDRARSERQARVRATLDRIDGDLAEGSALRKAAAARIDEASVQLQWSEDELARARPLREQGLVTERAWQELQSGRDGAAQRRVQLREELANTLARLATERAQAAAELAVLRAAEQDDTLLAPFDGVVLQRFAEEGETVGPERDLLKFGDVRALWIEGDVDEEDAPRVELGQKVLIRVAGDESALVAGRVHELFPDSEQATRSYRVRVTFDGSTFVASGAAGLAGATRAAGGHPLRVGSSCELGIVTGERADALWFPRVALTVHGTVFVLAEGRVHERKVDVGLANFERCEVLAGVASGEQVAIDGHAQLRNGLRAVARER